MKRFTGPGIWRPLSGGRRPLRLAPNPSGLAVAAAVSGASMSWTSVLASQWEWRRHFPASPTPAEHPVRASEAFHRVGVSVRLIWLHRVAKMIWPAPGEVTWSASSFLSLLLPAFLPWRTPFPPIRSLQRRLTLPKLRPPLSNPLCRPRPGRHHLMRWRPPGSAGASGTATQFQ